MKRAVTILVGLLLVLGAFAPARAGLNVVEGIKVGGGFLWNDKLAQDATGGGFHVSVDFKLLPSFNLTPFYEYSRRNGVASTLAGGEFHYKYGPFYFGPGFGIADANNQTKFHVNGVGGFKYKLTDRFGFFVQGKYAWAADDLLNGITVHGGLTFPFMK